MPTNNRVKSDVRRISLGKLEHVSGQTYALHFQPDQAQFVVLVNGREVAADSIGDLAYAITEQRRRDAVKLSIPFVCDWHGDLIDGVVTGVHSKNGRPLVKWAEKRCAGRAIAYSNVTMKPMTPIERKHYLKLLVEREQAENAFERYQKKFLIDLDEEVRKQVEKG